MKPAQFLPYVVPLIVIAVLYFRTSRSKPRPVSINSLWIVPLVALLGFGTAIIAMPHAAFGPAAHAIFAAALAAGIGTGMLRARTLTLRRCEDTGKVLMETTSYAFILLAVLVLLKTAFRGATGGGAVAVDASFLFALGMIVTQRLTLWIRVRALPA